MKNIILCLISLSFLMSDIYISGDARVRPRYDIIENGDGSSTSDLYYLYRARLNMKADIGEGWFFKTQLAAASVAGFTKMGDDNSDLVVGPGNLNSYRPTANFMQLYFGKINDEWGFWAGAFPLSYNSSLDLHFYSDKLVDMPFVLFNNSSTLGFSGYRTLMGYKLNWFLSVDNNVVEAQEFSDDAEPTDDCDDYTLGIDMFLNFGSVSVTPRLLSSFGGMEGDIYPMTYGADIQLPSIVGFNSGISYYTSVKGEDGDSDYYKADHMRLSISRKIKDAKLKFFYDIASKNDDKVDYMWLSFTQTIYKGEMGEVSISPTFRLQNGKGAGSVDSFNENYSRSKFEVTTQIKFK